MEKQSVSECYQETQSKTRRKWVSKRKKLERRMSAEEDKLERRMSAKRKTRRKSVNKREKLDRTVSEKNVNSDEKCQQRDPNREGIHFNLKSSSIRP